MRAQLYDNEEAKDFSKLLMDIGDGKIPKIPRAVHPDTINIQEKLRKKVSSFEGHTHVLPDWQCEIRMTDSKNYPFSFKYLC